MTIGKIVRVLLIISMVITGGALIGLNPAMQRGAEATGPPGNEVIQIPLRWCAVQGTTAVTNPGFFGEPDTDSVLWRRHERASDRIFIPGANITFRSSFTAAVLSGANFPIINDPSPPGPGNPSLLGDITDPQINATDFNTVISDCRNAWDAIATMFGTPLLGPIVVNINRFVDASGSPTLLWGWGGFTNLGPAGASECTNLAGITSASGGQVAVVDFSVTGTAALDGRLVAHELGHALRLGHGNGLDDNGNTMYDSWCDVAETSNAPATFMHPTIPSGNDTVSTLQRGTSRAVSTVYSGAQIDPPALLVSGDAISDQRSDVIFDVKSPSVDLTWAGLTVNQSQEAVIVHHGLVGLIGKEETNQYVLFADLDNDRSTGGFPEKLGFVTNFEGAELVTRVVVEPGRRPEGTVWRFDGLEFVDVTDDSVQVAIETPPGGETLTPLFNVVGMRMSLGLSGAIGGEVRLQALAEQFTGPMEIDVLPGGHGASPTDEGASVFLFQPEFPVCGVTPEVVQPGDTVTVEATGFQRRDEGAHVVLGDQTVATTTTDDEGALKAEFEIPSDSPLGGRLVTVGIDKTALTADCVVFVGERPADGIEQQSQEQQSQETPEAAD